MCCHHHHHHHFLYFKFYSTTCPTPHFTAPPSLSRYSMPARPTNHLLCSPCVVGLRRRCIERLLHVSARLLLRTLLKRDISSSSLSEIPKLGVKTYKAQGVTRRERRREKTHGGEESDVYLLLLLLLDQPSTVIARSATSNDKEITVVLFLRECESRGRNPNLTWYPEEEDEEDAVSSCVCVWSRGIVPASGSRARPKCSSMCARTRTRGHALFFVEYWRCSGEGNDVGDASVFLVDIHSIADGIENNDGAIIIVSTQFTWRMR